MREIKFRAWEATEQKFYYWGFINGAFVHAPIRNRETIEEVKEHSQQYTGLKDKNGTEIYEGDIVNGGTVSDKDGAYVMSLVVEYKNGLYEPIAYLNDDGMAELEVIGNIYENKEIM